MESKKKEFINPIDKDKIAENPAFLPYAHSVGGVQIKPIDKGRVKGLSLDAMYEQTNVQLDQIREQVMLLAEQAEKVHKRVEISEKIYQSNIGFIPVIGHTYYLYLKKDKSYIVSMVAPNEWGRSNPYQFISTIKLLSDHTWDILEDAFGV